MTKSNILTYENEKKKVKRTKKNMCTEELWYRLR